MRNNCLCICLLHFYVSTTEPILINFNIDIVLITWKMTFVAKIKLEKGEIGDENMYGGPIIHPSISS